MNEKIYVYIYKISSRNMQAGKNLFELERGFGVSVFLSMFTVIADYRSFFFVPLPHICKLREMRRAEANLYCCAFCF